VFATEMGIFPSAGGTMSRIAPRFDPVRTNQTLNGGRSVPIAHVARQVRPTKVESERIL